MVSFEVLPTSFQSGWANIIHMSIGNDHGRYGDRTPGVWFQPSSSSATTKKLTIYSAVNGYPNYRYDSTKMFPLNTWIRVKIEQADENGKATFRVYLDDEEVHEMINTQPRDFDNVKVYVSDPWYPPQAGKIRNLLIINRVASP